MSDLITKILDFPVLFSIQIGTCLMLTGLIWLVQLVHYPSFTYISDSEFTRFEKFHSFWISWIVIPLMTAELASALFLTMLFGFVSFWGLNLLGVILIWISTAIFSAPCHIQLDKSKDIKIIQKLVFTNWPRTILWTLRSGLLLFSLHGLL